MLLALSIRDVVLIDRLDLSFEAGLGVLTGETGAGKSILLDSLGLALGARADSGLVRKGADQLSVTATFDIESGHPALAVMADQGLSTEDDMLILRRVVTADGRSRAYLNDQACSVGLLRTVGDTLVEVHGQFDSHGLLDPKTHRAVLDSYDDLGGLIAVCRDAWTTWRAKARARAEAEAALADARAREEELRFAVEELSALAPEDGEEARLAETRTFLQHAEKILSAMQAGMGALREPVELESAIQTAQRHLSAVADKADGKLDPVLDALDRAAVEITEAVGQLEHVSGEIDLDPKQLEEVEERLFALRAVARKHGVTVDDLPGLLADLQSRLDALEAGGDDIARLVRAEQQARETYVEAARALSRARAEAAKGIDAAVAAELPPLKLDKARFQTLVAPLEESAWGPEGLDRVAFQVATNPGADPGPIGKIASGGELSRFMLALKVVLARTSPVPTLVFDEVDSGIGGATAAAVGERLGRLAADLQVLVVTHSPQVAARGDHHYRVAKTETPDGRVSTSVSLLPTPERREEIARMLAGSEVTEQARAAADSLLAKQSA